MQNSPNDDEAANSVVSNRTMNIVVSLLLMTLAAVVMFESYRLGAGWSKDVGPDSGYFPFYVGLMMFIASGVTFLQHLMAGGGKDGGSFISSHSLWMVLKVLIPTTVFCAASIIIGIYIPTALFIIYFMMVLGSYSLLKSLPVALIVPVVLFVVFEVYFLVPLPKGPIEAWLGF